MIISGKAVLQALGLVNVDLLLLVQEAEFMDRRMKVLEAWQLTMDTILKNMQEPN